MGGSVWAAAVFVTAGDQNHRFVAQAYLDLLGRTVDPSGLQFWGDLLDAGTLNRLQFSAQYNL